jgi:glycosyltransferase involved in cell wall biosynthesis
VRDVFEQGEDDGGVIVPRDDAVAFAAALGELVDDAERRRALGTRAKRRVDEHFGLEHVGRRLRTVFVGTR